MTHKSGLAELHEIPQEFPKESCTDVEGVVQSTHLPGPCRSGGTGRRKGLKIPRA